jgi:predicted transcriptional regulator
VLQRQLAVRKIFYKIPISSIMLPFFQTKFIQDCAITLAPETSVEFAVQLMSQVNTSYVLVLEQHQIRGIFTEQELVKAIASG